MKKLIALLLALVMVFGMVACAATEPETTTAATNNAASGETEAVSGEEGDKWDDMETLVIPLFTPFLDKFAEKGITMYSQTWLGGIILDKFNIDFELLQQPDDKNTYYMNALASGNYPAILSYPSVDVLNAYYEAGALVCLDDYQDQLPDFYASYDESVLAQLRAKYPDGKMWSWGGDTPVGNVLAYGYTSIVDIIVQSNLLEEYGLDNLPVTADEWLDFFIASQAANPTAPDGTKVYAFTFPGATNPVYLFGLVQYRDGKTPMSVDGTFAIGYDSDADAFYPMAISESAKTMFKWSNDMFKAGVLDPECYTLDRDVMTEKAGNGYVLAIGDNAYSDATINAALEAVYGDLSRSVVQMPIITDENAGRINPGSTTGQNLALTTAVDPADYERIFAWLNFMRSEEGLLLYGSGLEGVDYEIVDGVRYPIGKYAEEMANGYAEGYAFERGMWESYSLALLFGSSWGDYSGDGQPFRLNKLSTVATEIGCNDVQKELYDKLGWESNVYWWTENAERVDVTKPNSVTALGDTPVNDQMTKIHDLMFQYASKLTFADDFEAVWEEFVQKMEAAGIQDAVDYCNSCLG